MNKAIFNNFNKKLFNPNEFNDNIDFKYSSISNQINHYRDMLIIRYAEEKISEKIIEGKINCPCHLGIGQEAVSVGISSFLNKNDSVFGAHRSHSHFLALNNDVYSLFAETLGRFDGCSHGMGGSMHLIDQENGFYGSVPIVGATIPIAVGAAFSHKFDNSKNISVSYFGDGATEEGCFHESLNLAVINKLPVLFVCENNLFSSHMHILERQPELSTVRFANSHSINYLLVDGNDISSVYKSSKKAIDHIRSGNGPFYLEFITYRWKGHVGPKDDNDVGLQRSDDIDVWKKRDPVKRFFKTMVDSNRISKTKLEDVEKEVKDLIDISWNNAEKSPYPDKNFLSSIVYSS